MAPVAKALKDAGLSVSDIDEVILRRFYSYAKIADEVEKFFGKASKGVNPDEVVAIGAAIQGSFWRCKCIVTCYTFIFRYRNYGWCYDGSYRI
jgi:hypothetical protein